MNKRLVGTVRYSSVHALGGYEQSRRDDMEGLCYVMVYFLKGKLPWQGIKIENKEERYKVIYEIKKKINVNELIGNEFPYEFKEFVTYCRNLRFEEEPNYTYLKGLIKSIIMKYQFEFDNNFDWKEDEINWKKINVCFSNEVVRKKLYDDEDNDDVFKEDEISNNVNQVNKIKKLSTNKFPKVKFMSAVKGNTTQKFVNRVITDKNIYLRNEWKRINTNTIFHEQNIDKINILKTSYGDLNKEYIINNNNRNLNTINGERRNKDIVNNTNNNIPKEIITPSNEAHCILF